MKTYIGRRHGDQHHTARFSVDWPMMRQIYPLKLHNAPGSPYPHSPDGHTWGYSGSGPTQAALDILWDHLGHEPERRVYQAFRDAFLANATGETVSIAADDIDAWLKQEGFASVVDTLEVDDDVR